MSDAYKRAGVDITAGNEAVERMKKHVKRTLRPEVLTDLGGFGGLFQLNNKYEEPVLVSSTDGVGTKLKIAFAMDKHDTIGIDAVAMCVNDLIVQGAEPLFFLDYLACSQVVPEKIESIIKGISDACVASGCALIGGETAEMPGMYHDGEYDIAGFSVGVVEKKQLIDGSTISSGDVLLGLASSGLHSNGYSLVRKLLLEEQGYKLDQHMATLNDVLGQVLLTPTKLYVKSILAIMEHVKIKGMAHITGGGFIENIPRVLPEGINAHIQTGSWPILPIFDLIQQSGSLSHHEMFRTFNMGIGMVIVVDGKDADEVIEIAKANNEDIYVIGHVTQGEQVVTFDRTVY